MAPDLRRFVFDEYRNLAFIPLTFVTSFFALRPDSTLIPNIINLSVLYTYAPFLFRADEPRRWWKVGATALSLTLGSFFPRLHASREALSSPAQSGLTLVLLSAILSSFTLGAAYAGTRISPRLRSSSSQITLFPAIWATLWVTVSYLSPVGHLSTWSVANNADAYNWLVPYFGPAIEDWVVAAWAVVVSQSVTGWYMGYEETDNHVPNLIHPPSVDVRRANHHASTRKLLAAFLVVLTIPSFTSSTLPLPISQIESATPISVGCVNPPFHQHKHHITTLDDWIKETNRLRGLGGDLLLWPEGAVSFNTAEEREDAFSKVREKVTGPYVGVSFEETIANPADPSGRSSLRRTGIAIISQYSEEPHLIYHKRHLVPFAESFRLRQSNTPPSIFDLPLRNPGHGITDGQWAKGGNHTRPIPVTADICLDFAHPNPFAGLPSRPALILAPARTWDRTVGYAMWLQAKQRAEELGTMVLWCDGGDGGVSGVAGGGFNDVTQVGSGSFLKKIGMEFPFEKKKTVYARIGDSVLIFLWVSVLGSGALGVAAQNLPWLQRRLLARATRGRDSSPSPVITQPNLIDV